MQGLKQWEASPGPYTQQAACNAAGALDAADSGVASVIGTLRCHDLGLVVVGEQLHSSDAVACFQIADELGWPLAAGALSGTFLRSYTPL